MTVELLLCTQECHEMLYDLPALVEEQVAITSVLEH